MNYNYNNIKKIINSSQNLQSSREAIKNARYGAYSSVLKKFVILCNQNFKNIFQNVAILKTLYSRQEQGLHKKDYYVCLNVKKYPLKYKKPYSASSDIYKTSI